MSAKKRKDHLKTFLIDLLKEHIRQMEEEYHITAFSNKDLKLAKRHLKKLRNSEVIVIPDGPIKWPHTDNKNIYINN